MFHFKIDAARVNSRMSLMQDRLSRLTTFEVSEEMQAWQMDQFKRNRQNIETLFNGDAVSVSTKFWDRTPRLMKSGKFKKRYALHRAVRKQLLIGKWKDTSKVRKRLARPIIRPELVVDLYVRMVNKAKQSCQWPR
jgi:hypothetical protein